MTMPFIPLVPWPLAAYLFNYCSTVTLPYSILYTPNSEPSPPKPIKPREKLKEEEIQ